MTIMPAPLHPHASTAAPTATGPIIWPRLLPAINNPIMTGTRVAEVDAIQQRGGNDAADGGERDAEQQRPPPLEDRQEAEQCEEHDVVEDKANGQQCRTAPAHESCDSTDERRAPR